MGTAAFSANDIRSAVMINTAGDYIVAGATVAPYVGYLPAIGGTTTTLPATVVNPRCAIVYSNTLFYSVAGAPGGVFRLGAVGVLSTAAGQASTAVSATGTYANLSPTSFVFQSSSVMWVCDDSATTTAYGVWKLSGTLGAASSFTGESRVKGNGALLLTQACISPR